METYLIPCLLGLEKLVSDEVKRLGLQEVQAENGRILCRGTLADAARLNLNLRCGARVLLVLGRFPARSFEELFQGTRAIAWENYLPENAAFPVKGYSISSQLHSVPACQSIIKKAMVERMKAHYHREQFPEDGVKYQVRFSLFKDEAALCLDTSGEGLYKRGYRAVGVEAPLRETLAAAMVLLSRYRGKDPFCDPFCGSGTIPIEAALIAKNRAPGLDRSFDAQRWAFLPAKVWMDAADEAMDKEFHGHYDIWRRHRPPCRGHCQGQCPQGGGGGYDPLRGGGHERLPPGQHLRPVGDQSPLRRAANGEAGGRGPVPGAGTGLVSAAGGLADAGAQQPYGVRTLLRTARRQEAQALQRYDQVRPVHVRQCVRTPSISHGLPHKFSICSFNFLP